MNTSHMYLIILILIITASLCSSSMLTFATVTEGFSKSEKVQINLDAVQYGPIAESYQKIADRKITSFKVPLPLDHIKAPKENTSDAVVAELHYLSKLTRKQTSTEKRRMADKFSRKGSVKKYFIKFAGEKGLAYDNKHIDEVFRDLDTLCAGLKIYYNRPRPAQLAFIHQIDIDTIGAAETPSYPCEQTTKAHVLASVLAFNNPEYKKQLNALAKKIELSQLYGGLAFPSDNIAAIQVANVIKKRVRYLELKK